MINARMKIEITCTECNGSGSLTIAPLNSSAEFTEVTCSFCDGSGFMELYINLEGLKNLLDGGDL